MQRSDQDRVSPGAGPEAPGWSKLGFSTCSYLHTLRGPRARIVRHALGTWGGLLSLPFQRRVFLDDQSPDCNAIRNLAAAGCLTAFDGVHYCSFAHPPHSNFGIVLSYELTDTPYILHLDDDVEVTGAVNASRAFVEEALHVLDTDPAILGINLLTLTDVAFDTQGLWKPDAPYDGPGGGPFAHPKAYFGTCASLIRRELLDVVGLDAIRGWGAEQPAHWERLVSRDPGAFLVSTAPTPFSVSQASFFDKSTTDRTWRQRARFRLRQSRPARALRRLLRPSAPPGGSA